MSISAALFAISLSVLSVCGGDSERLEVGMQKGQVHPDFELPTLDGKRVKLSDYAGRKVVLIHFASW